MNKYTFLTTLTIALGIWSLAAAGPEPTAGQGLIEDVVSLNEREWEIGEIRYSVLPENLFIERNGKGWQLLNGDLRPDSKLANLIYDYQKANSATGWGFPDARGRFLRGQDSRIPHDPVQGNPAGNLSIGTYQSGAVQYMSQVMIWDGSGDIALAKHGSSAKQARTMPLLNASQIKATETRPRCVTVNIFVRVN